MSIHVSDTFMLPGIPSDKTVHFNAGNVYYESMDEPGRETFKCFSLQHNKLVWSKNINQMGINEGAITANGEYVVPTLSDTVYLIAADGNARVLKLEYRCKINPLVYKNTFILQDRGVGLKCFDAKTLQQLWLIKQQSSFTMSQPLIIDSNLIYILDDKSIQSSKVTDGKLNWRITVADTFALYDLYGKNKDLIFILSTNLKRQKKLAAINCKNGNLLWQAEVDSTVNELERDMVVTNSGIFCRGDSSIFSYSIKDGSRLRKHDYKSRVATNLVADKSGNILFALDDQTLMKIDDKGSEILTTSFKDRFNRLYCINDSIFLYSYPNLFRFEVLDRK